MGAELIESGIDTVKALRLRLQGLSYAEIGKIAGGLSPQAIEQRLSKFRKLVEHPEAIQSFREHEAELLDGVRMELITSLVEDMRRKGKKALSGYQKVGMYGLLFDKTRLLRGQSTENIANLTAIIQAVHSGNGKAGKDKAGDAQRGDSDALQAGDIPEQGSE